MRFGHSLHEAGYMGLLQRMVALDGLPAGEGYAQLKLFVGAAAGAGMGEVAGADYHRQTGEQLAASPLLPTLRPHHSLESKNTLTVRAHRLPNSHQHRLPLAAPLLRPPGSLLRLASEIGGQFSSWGVQLQRAPPAAKEDFGVQLAFGQGGVSADEAQGFIRKRIPGVLRACDALLRAMQLGNAQ